MKSVFAIFFCGLLVGAEAPAQTSNEPAAGVPPQQEIDEVRAMEEQRAQLLRELQRLRDELAASEARMQASQERIRKLESQRSQTQSKP